MQKIKTALLSYGMSGKVFHAPFLNIHSGFELIGAWQRNQQKMQIDYPNAKSYATLESLLEDDIDLIIVNTPVETHFEYAKKALLAGKHVLVEKAFTCNAIEAQELCNLARAKDLKLAVFQNRRWDSDFKTVKAIYNQGILGDIVEAEFHFDRYNPILSPKTHKETSNAGSGVLKDLGPHIIDQALHLFGFPEAVFADIRITREHSLVDDWIDITLYYTNFRARLKAGFFVREAISSYVLHGKKGSFLKPRGDVQEDHLKAGLKPNTSHWGNEAKENESILHTEKDGVVIREKVPTQSGNYYDFFDAMYHSIVSNKLEPVTAQEGVNVMLVIDAAIQSNTEKKVVYL